MPKNKAQLNRIKQIDLYLNRQYQSTMYRVKRKDLANRFNVSEKTISRDIRFMKNEFNAPIKYDNRGYFYTEKFSIPLNLGLTGLEINQLKIAVKILSQYKHFSIFSELDSLIDKIEHSVRFNLSETKRNFIYFEKVPSYKGTEHLDFFIEAIEYNRVISFDYQSYKTTTPLNHQIHPYILKEHTNRWYVIGLLPEQNSITAFALERIVKNTLKSTTQYFDISPEFNPDIFFKYTFGMTVHSDRSVEKVILSFTPLQAKYFISKPFHPYKKLLYTKDELRVEMEIIPNFELIRKVVSFGSGVKVIAPKSFKKEVINYMKSTLSLYEEEG